MGTIWGGKSAPDYNMSPEYRRLTFDTTYPKLEEIIKSGGIGLDTTRLERGAKENIAANYGGAFDRVRAFSAPYGNPAAGNRLALRIAGSQAGEESRAITGIRTTSEQDKVQTLMGTLGLASGMQDPNLQAYYARLAKYKADQANDVMRNGLLGDLATLGITAINPGAGAVYGMARSSL